MSNIVDTLVEMGFPKNRVEYAISKANAKNVEEAMEWLLAHEDEPIPETVQVTDEPKEASEEVPASASKSPERMETESPSEESPDSNAVAKSIKCEECGKLFTNQTEIEFHASKTGHEKFSESTEEKKPLTEEEKKEQLAKIEAKLRQRRLDREAREKQEALEREKNRIRSGKELAEAKKKQDEMEIKKIVEQRKREKEEERLARQRVRDQIEQDKLMRKAKFGGGAPQEINLTPVVTPEKPVTVVSTTPNKNHNEAKLQIRLTNGSVLTHTFGAKEPLSVVKCYIEMNRTDEPGPFSLMTSFPRKVFTGDDFEKPLYLLDLAPTAVLIVTKSA